MARFQLREACKGREKRDDESQKRKNANNWIVDWKGGDLSDASQRSNVRDGTFSERLRVDHNIKVVSLQYIFAEHGVYSPSADTYWEGCVPWEQDEFLPICTSQSY